MEATIPSLEAVREAHPSELAVLLSTVSVDEVRDLSRAGCEAVVVATQRVASWAHALQAAGVDRFAELVTDDVEIHVADLAARGVTRRGRDGAVLRVVPVPEPDAIAASSLAPLLNIAPRTMRTRLNRARVLVELPRTFALAVDGRLEPWRVDGVVVAARDVAPERVAEFEARLYDQDVTALPKPRLVARAQRAAAKADPDGAKAARRAAPRRRALRWAPSEVPGLMRWSAEVPDEQSRQLAAAVDTLAQEYLTADAHARSRDHAAGTPTRERRSVEAARLDAMVDLVRANAHVSTTVQLVVPARTATVPTAVTRRPHRDVITDELERPLTGNEGPVATDLEVVDPVLVDLVAGSVTHRTLAAGSLERTLGLRLGERLETTGNPFLTTTPVGGSATAPCDGERVWFVPGLVEVPGTTGMLPEQVTALLSDPDTRLRVTSADTGTADGPPGRRRTYRPGKELAATVRTRDLHCRFPGCSVPAPRCHLDHVVAFPHGETKEANLHCLCPAHHGFKHHAGWSLTMTPDGTCTWTAPTGRTHTTHPGTRHDDAA